MLEQWNQPEPAPVGDKLTEAAVKEAAKPTPEKPAEKPAEKPPEKAADKPTDKVAPAKTVEAEKPKGPLALLGKAHDELKKQVATDYVPKIAQLNKELGELKEILKAKDSIDPKEFETVKQERERIAGELRVASYERSDDFKKEFLEPRNSLYREAVAEIKELTVTMRNPETQETTERPATEQDLRAIMAMQPRDQDKALAEMFGTSARRVGDFIFEMKRIERAAHTKLAEERASGDKRIKDASEKTAKERAETQKQYDMLREKSHKALEDSAPQIFKALGENDEGYDKDIAVALKTGYENFDRMVAESSKATIEMAASNAAEVRARYAAHGRLVLENKRMAEELETLRARVTAKEKSDPGAGGEGGEGAPSGDDDFSIGKLAGKWDA